MKKILLIMILLLAGTFGLSGTSQAYTNVSVSIGFHDALAPYGTWFNYSNYGNCWRPHAYAGWSPYTQGHWEYTSYGPMWDTPEPYGWATYHYGQWVYSASYGWIWVPGYDYYPSRVSWAYGNDYLAWSPVYPAPSYANVNLWFGIERDHWGYNDYRNVILRGDRVRPLFERRAVQIRNGRLDRADFERFARRPVQVVPVEQRIIRADNRQLKVVVPRNRAQIVDRELTRAQKQRTAVDRNDRFNANDRNNRNERIVEKRDSKGNRVFENRSSNNKREVEVRNKSNQHKSEVTTKYSGKKIISKPSSKISKPSSKSKNSNYNHKTNNQPIPRNMASRESSKKSHESSVKYSSRSNNSRSKAPVHYSNRYSTKSHQPSKSYSHKSSPREVNSKYSSNSHRPEMRQSSKQVNQVSRKEVHQKQQKATSQKQNRKPPKKH